MNTNNTIDREKLLAELESACSAISARIDLPDKEKEQKLGVGEYHTIPRSVKVEKVRFVRFVSFVIAGI